MFVGGASRSFSVYPLRVVYMDVESTVAPASLLISVPKKRFKRAVKRNYVKRQIREGYRKNKEALHEVLQSKQQCMAIAIIYLSDELISTHEIEAKVKLLLTRMIEQMA